MKTELHHAKYGLCAILYDCHLWNVPAPEPFLNLMAEVNNDLCGRQNAKIAPKLPTP